MAISKRLNRTIPAIAAAALLGTGIDSCQAGKLFRWWKGLGDDCCPSCSTCESNCGCQNRAQDSDDHDCCWKPRPAPLGAVVSSIPAVMVAQPAVAINTQAVQVQAAAQSCQSAEQPACGQNQTEAILRLLIERLQTTPIGAVPATPSVEQSAQHVAEVESLETQIGELEKALDRLNAAMLQSDPNQK